MALQGRPPGFISERKIYYKEGQLLGKLCFIKDVFSPSYRKAIFKCKCGKEFIATISHVKDQKIVSCGCSILERSAKFIKHGCSRKGNRTSEYVIWCKMRNRCMRSLQKDYHNYGGRGIKVCERWKDFNYFLQDMGLRPTPNHSLDRINNDGDYEPSNCRWATKKQQSNNTRKNRIIIFNGESKTVMQWAEILNVRAETLYNRFNKGWSAEDIILTPIGMSGKKNKIENNNEIIL